MERERLTRFKVRASSASNPMLRPGEEFEYTSGVVIQSPAGNMSGTYEMQRLNGRVFEAVIAPFALARPYSIN